IKQHKMQFKKPIEMFWESRVELHVFYVPDDQFDRRLNKVSAEAVDTFVSAGFIRVDSDVSLSDLRSDLGTFLGLDRIADRYVFFKCVGRSLALVSSYHCRIIYKLVKMYISVQPKAGVYFIYLFLHYTKSTFNEDFMCFHRFLCIDQPLHSQQREVLHCLSIPLNFIHNKQPLVRRLLITNKLLLTNAVVILAFEYHTQHFMLSENELIEEIKLLKGQRKELEQTRQELLKNGRELLALNRHPRDRWKRQYFDTKKATTLLEDTLKSVRLELHTFYSKMLQQLQARDGAKRRTQNELIIQIMTESSEIDNLRKNVDDAKMKLATEIKVLNRHALVSSAG
uniref:Spermatogenesis-associated protein 1 C-terminal domain-containing protein n=1 Tax=Sinocyclocheilus rhinocerous TaxID=307959 RepID=A0A673NHJ1_9TELE